MNDEGKQGSGMVCCEACGTAVPAYDAVNHGSIEQGYRKLCNRCFNAEVANAVGLEGFGNVRLHPVVKPFLDRIAVKIAEEGFP